MKMVDQFYSQTNEPSLRFGDVVSGFTACTPVIDDPLNPISFKIEVSRNPYFAILSPCCSIEGKVISLAPLVKVKPGFFKNPFFKEDLTRINGKIPAAKTLPPEEWEKLLPEERERRLNTGDAYGFHALFVYDESEHFQPYDLRFEGGTHITTKYYMVDFRQAFRVSSQVVKRDGEFPTALKCLQLSIATRALLRDKISYYFARIPEEDMVL
jgi:hypothetical protein